MKRRNLKGQMKDTLNIESQLTEVIATHVENGIAQWVLMRTPPGTDAETAAQLAQFATANRAAFWNEIAPQVVSHYIRVYQEGAAILQDCEKRMFKAARNGSIMNYFLPTPLLPPAAPKPAPQLLAAAPTPAPINIDLFPQINISMPSMKKRVEFERDERRSLTAATIECVD